LVYPPSPARESLLRARRTIVDFARHAGYAPNYCTDVFARRYEPSPEFRAALAAFLSRPEEELFPLESCNEPAGTEIPA
jgi:hypothetical protein